MTENNMVIVGGGKARAPLFEKAGPFDHLVITRGIAPPGTPIAPLDLGPAQAFIEVMLVSALSLAMHAQGKLRVEGAMTFTSGISKDRPAILGGSVVSVVVGSFGYLARALVARTDRRLALHRSREAAAERLYRKL